MRKTAFCLCFAAVMAVCGSMAAAEDIYLPGGSSTLVVSKETTLTVSTEYSFQSLSWHVDDETVLEKVSYNTTSLTVKALKAGAAIVSAVGRDQSNTPKELKPIIVTVVTDSSNNSDSGNTGGGSTDSANVASVDATIADQTVNVNASVDVTPVVHVKLNGTETSSMAYTVSGKSADSAIAEVSVINNGTTIRVIGRAVGTTTVAVTPNVDTITDLRGVTFKVTVNKPASSPKSGGGGCGVGLGFLAALAVIPVLARKRSRQ